MMMMMMMLTTTKTKTISISREGVRRKERSNRSWGGFRARKTIFNDDDHNCEGKKAAMYRMMGQESQTGRLVMAIAAETYGGRRVKIMNTTQKMPFGDEGESVIEGMGDELFLKRFYCSRKEFDLISDFDTSDVDDTNNTYMFCHENGSKQLQAMESLASSASLTNAKCVMLSRCGISRKREHPFAKQNEPVQMRETVKIGAMALQIGNAIGEPEIGALDAFEKAEELAIKTFGKENVKIVRSGELRGNSALLLADLSARLVDNMYDVKYQDLYVYKGDQMQGYTKRLNLAQFLVRVADDDAVTQISNDLKDVTILSVVCKTLPIIGEQTITEPTDRERRKGFDMSKGKAPPPIAFEDIDKLLASAL
jgi:hypothetical protein